MFVTVLDLGFWHSVEDVLYYLFKYEGSKIKSNFKQKGNVGGSLL